MEIRKTQLTDVDRLEEIYAGARRFMAEHGNPNQWGPTHWPPRSVIEEDIQNGHSYVCTDKDRIVGTFCLVYGAHADPQYDRITEGSWPSRLAMDPDKAEQYGVIHRLAGDGSVKGIGAFCLEWAFARCGHLRMDTHGDNTVMQNLMKKSGFVQCGIVHVIEDDIPRLAFERFDPDPQPKTAFYQSPFGWLQMTSDGYVLTGLSWSDKPTAPSQSCPVFDETKTWLDRYFQKEDPGPRPFYYAQGTPFQRAVWSLVAQVPYGQTATYGMLAEQLKKATGRRQSAQAVGQAVRKNPISILIPCHRIIGQNGRLVGYSAGSGSAADGLDIKVALLNLEQKTTC